MRRTKIFLLDLDMTLVNTLRGLYISVINTIPRYTKRDIDDLFKIENFVKEYYLNDFNDYVSSNDPETRWRFWSDVWIRYISDPGLYGEPYKCVHEIIYILRGLGIVLIVTGREISSLKMIDELSYYGFKDLVHNFVSTGDLGPFNKKKDLLEKIIDHYIKTGFSHDDIIVISDSIKDLEYAEKLKVRGAGFVPKEASFLEKIFKEKGLDMIKSWCEQSNVVRTLGLY
jgi:phosphoglycolate phosphatase-like HAD superfamily hydrolase